MEGCDGTQLHHHVPVGSKVIASSSIRQHCDTTAEAVCYATDEWLSPCIRSSMQKGAMENTSRGEIEDDGSDDD